jgi:hypothetical protein
MQVSEGRVGASHADPHTYHRFELALHFGHAYFMPTSCKQVDI